MKLEKLKSAKKILVYGYGLEGKSSEKFLREKTSAEIKIFDEFIEKFAGNNDFENYDVIVVSSGINREKIPRNFRDKCTSNPEIFFNNLDEKSPPQSGARREKIIGISGTKGKSTTTKFCAEFLENAGFKVKIGGNYGIPLLDLWDHLSPKLQTTSDFFLSTSLKTGVGNLDYIVAELSSYQLENLQVSPHFAIFLDFFPDHLDRHLTLQNYWNAKANLWRHQNSRDFLIIPESCRDLAADIETEAQIVFAPPIPAKFFPENSVFRAPHWLDNFGAVFQLAKIIATQVRTLGSPDLKVAIEQTAQNFAGLPHRMEFFAEKEGIEFYDDSISTNPDSTLASVNFFADRLGCILLGGQDRQQNFTALLQRLKDLGTLVIVLPTESRENLLKTIEKVGLTNFVDMEKWTGFEEIVEIIMSQIPHRKAGRGAKKVCLLSCAAPSYDVFKNFIDRGKQFKQAVRSFQEDKMYCNSPLN